MKKKLLTIVVLLIIIYSNDSKIPYNIMSITINSKDSQACFNKSAINIIHIPPKIQTTIDWEKKIIPIIQNMFFNIPNDNEQKNIKTLYISIIENDSDQIINNHQATSILIKILNTLYSKHFYIINEKIPHVIYKNIKLTYNNLTSRSQAIKLARYVNAHYTLYSSISKNLNNQISFELQLISVKNGEIIWSNITSI